VSKLFDIPVFLSIFVVASVIGGVANLISWRLIRPVTNSVLPGWITFAAWAVSLTAMIMVYVSCTVYVKQQGAVVHGDRVFLTNDSMFGRYYLRRLMPLDFETISIQPWRETVRGHLDMTVSNPHGLYYEVVITSQKDPVQCLALYRWGQRTEQTVEDWLKSQLIELNKAKSNELLEFYNPYNPKQQRQFGQVVKEWLKPSLPPGVKIESVMFFEP